MTARNEMKILTQAELKAIAESVANTSDGPWTTGSRYPANVVGYDDETVAICEFDADAVFIASTKQVVPRLLSHIAALSTPPPSEVAPGEKIRAALEIAKHLANATINGQPKSYRTTIAWDFHGALDAIAALAGGDWRDRFWQIVDGKGLLGLPSDEWNALSRLVDRYAATQPDEAKIGEVEKLAEAYAQAVREHSVEVAKNGTKVRQEMLGDVLTKRRQQFRAALRAISPAGGR